MHPNLRLFGAYRELPEGRGSEAEVPGALSLLSQRPRLTELLQLIVAEAEPGLSGHKLAYELAKHPNISVTIIPDSGVFALMARVNKVHVAPHSPSAGDNKAVYNRF